jgi:hypothetical protein
MKSGKFTESTSTAIDKAGVDGAIGRRRRQTRGGEAADADAFSSRSRHCGIRAGGHDPFATTPSCTPGSPIVPFSFDAECAKPRHEACSSMTSPTRLLFGLSIIPRAWSQHCSLCFNGAKRPLTIVASVDPALRQIPMHSRRVMSGQQKCQLQPLVGNPPRTYTPRPSRECACDCTPVRVRCSANRYSQRLLGTAVSHDTIVQ